MTDLPITCENTCLSEMQFLCMVTAVGHLLLLLFRSTIQQQQQQQ
jgi:hypothetical protein